MKPPTTIDVGPFTYTVTSRQADIDGAIREAIARGDDPSFYGVTDHPTQRIILSPTQGAGMLRDTVLHETLHAITRMVGIADDFTVKEEEGIVARLTPALLDVLRRNPELVAYLAAE